MDLVKSLILEGLVLPRAGLFHFKMMLWTPDKLKLVAETEFGPYVSDSQAAGAMEKMHETFTKKLVEQFGEGVEEVKLK